MRPWIRSWLLAGSLLLNLALVAGILVGWSSASATSLPRHSELVKSLDLNPAQQEALAASACAFKEQPGNARIRRFLRMRNLIDALRREGTSVEDLQAGIKRLNQAIQVELDNQQIWYLAILGVLDQRQREILANCLEARPYQSKIWQALRERFDLNRDGLLSPSEQAHAAATLAAETEAAPPSN